MTESSLPPASHAPPPPAPPPSHLDAPINHHVVAANAVATPVTHAPSHSATPHLTNGFSPALPATAPPVDEEDYTISCVCDYQDDDGNTVQCERCEEWQHIECYYGGQRPPGEGDRHLCVNCEPRPLDGKKATERQRARREELDPGDPKKPKKPAARDRKKKAQRAAAADAQAPPAATNGWAAPGERGDGASPRNGTGGSPREQPPAKRQKTGHHKPSNSVHTTGGNNNSTTTVPLKPPAPARRSASASHPLPSPTKTTPHPPSPVAAEPPYSAEFMRLYDEDRDPGDAPMSTNIFNDISITDKLTLWTHDAEAVQEAANGRLPHEIFMRCAEPLDGMALPAVAVQERVDAQTLCHGRHPRWKLLTVEQDVASDAILGELKGRVGHMTDYIADAGNRWEELRHPAPFVFFHPWLPIYIDTRHEGTRCRYLRRSCRPTVVLRTIVENDQDLRFSVHALRPLEAGTELTCNWTPDIHVRSFIVHGGDGDGGAADGDGAAQPPDPERPDAGRDKYVGNFYRKVAAEFGGCACNAGDECMLAGWERRRRMAIASEAGPSAEPAPASNGKAAKPRSRRPTKSRANNNHNNHQHPQAPNGAAGAARVAPGASRSGSEARRFAAEEDTEDDRSTSPSAKSKTHSRDPTPGHHSHHHPPGAPNGGGAAGSSSGGAGLGADAGGAAGAATSNGLLPGLPDLTNREKRKLADLQKRDADRAQPPPAKRTKKRPSGGATTGGAAAAPAVAAATSGTGTVRSHPAPTTASGGQEMLTGVGQQQQQQQAPAANRSRPPTTNPSPTAKNPALQPPSPSMPAKKVYVDASVQTDPTSDDEKWALPARSPGLGSGSDPNSATAMPPPPPRPRYVSHAQRLLQRSCAVHRKMEAAQQALAKARIHSPDGGPPAAEATTSTGKGDGDAGAAGTMDRDGDTPMKDGGEASDPPSKVLPPNEPTAKPSTAAELGSIAAAAPSKPSPPPNAPPPPPVAMVSASTGTLPPSELPAKPLPTAPDPPAPPATTTHPPGASTPSTNGSARPRDLHVQLPPPLPLGGPAPPSHTTGANSTTAGAAGGGVASPALATPSAGSMPPPSPALPTPTPTTTGPAASAMLPTPTGPASAPTAPPTTTSPASTATPPIAPPSSTAPTPALHPLALAHQAAAAAATTGAVVQPSPVKKKMSMSDYRKLKGATAAGAGAVAALPRTPSADQDPAKGVLVADGGGGGERESSGGSEAKSEGGTKPTSPLAVEGARPSALPDGAVGPKETPAATAGPGSGDAMDVDPKS